MSAVLYDYWRSSASYRVRIALPLLKIPYETTSIDLLSGEHRQAGYLAINPQGFVPSLVIDGQVLTQSLAIIEYLAETRPGSGLLPVDPVSRHHVRSLAYAIAMDIHPVCNLNVVSHVVALTRENNAREKWMQNFIGSGLAAFERMLDKADAGQFCFGDTPTLADICLVPQIYNARRWDVDVSLYPKTSAIDQRACALPEFQAAHPENAQNRRLS
jgi:maleylacetoacetate isomerase